MSFKFAVEGVLFDKVMQARSLTFMRVVTVWLLRIATQSVYTPDKTIKYVRFWYNTYAVLTICQTASSSGAT